MDVILNICQPQFFFIQGAKEAIVEGAMQGDDGPGCQQRMRLATWQTDQHPLCYWKIWNFDEFRNGIQSPYNFDIF